MIWPFTSDYNVGTGLIRLPGATPFLISLADGLSVTEDNGGAIPGTEVRLTLHRSTRYAIEGHGVASLTLELQERESMVQVVPPLSES